VRAARCAGASWGGVAVATRTTADAAWVSVAEVLDRQVDVLGRDVRTYR
jgi:hypothetical protein